MIARRLSRIAEQQRSAAGADTSARLDEVIAAAAASGDAASAREAERLRTGPVEPPSGPLSAPDFEARRRRLLSLIDALAVAQPTLRPRAPVCGTGVEGKVAADSGAAVLARRDGRIIYVTAERIVIETREKDEDGKPYRDVYHKS